MACGVTKRKAWFQQFWINLRHANGSASVLDMRGAAGSHPVWKRWMFARLTV